MTVWCHVGYKSIPIVQRIVKLNGDFDRAHPHKMTERNSESEFDTQWEEGLERNWMGDYLS